MSKLGIAGCGIIAEFLLDGAKRSGAELVAVCDQDTDLAAERATGTDARIYGDFDDFLADERMEAVILALPNFMHHAFGCKVLDAGKHLFCEKPMTTDVRDSLSLARKAEESGLVFQMGYMKRFNPAFGAIKELMAEIGPVYSGHVQLSLHGAGWAPAQQAHEAGSWHADRAKSGGATLTHGGSHHLDLIQYLFGPPRRAFGRVLVDASGDEYGTNVTFDTGDSVPVLLDIMLVSMQPGSAKGTDWDERIEVLGHNGRITAQGYDWQGRNRCTLEVETAQGKRHQDFDASLQWVNEFAAFQKALAGEQTVASTARDGYRVDLMLSKLRPMGRELTLIDFDYEM